MPRVYQGPKVCLFVRFSVQIPQITVVDQAPKKQLSWPRVDAGMIVGLFCDLAARARLGVLWCWARFGAERTMSGLAIASSVYFLALRQLSASASPTGTLTLAALCALLGVLALALRPLPPKT